MILARIATENHMRPMTAISIAALFAAPLIFMTADSLSAQEAGRPKAQPSRPSVAFPDTATSAKVAPHRQPRAADVPTDPAAMQESDEDRILNQKLKSICRGC
jgi:hypothetical protein